MQVAVVIGGGISGLTAAYQLVNSGQYQVHVVEKSNKLGGLLKSFDYGAYGHFDYGAHNILETGIEELDDFYLNLLPEDKWQVATTSDGRTRALTGLMYNEKLQHNSPFIDLRDNKKLNEFIGDFFVNLNNQIGSLDDVAKMDAYAYSRYLFGEKITDEIIVPCIKKLYGYHPSKLNSMVLFLTQFTRVVLFEEHLMEEMVMLNNISSRLSYTNQMNLPAQYLTHLRSFYPREFGIYRVIEAIEKQLKDRGVIFHLNSTIDEIDLKDNMIKSVSINGNKLAVNHLVSSVSLNILANMFKIDLSGFNPDKGLKTVMTNLLISKPLNAGELSFIYSYDDDSQIFRVDNYISYCSEAKREDLYPVTVESIHRELPDIKKLEDKIISELIEYKLLDQGTEVGFVKTEVLDYGFPLLTQNNVDISNAMRKEISDLEIQNLTRIGILSEEGLFFESDVIRDAYTKIKEIL